MDSAQLGQVLSDAFLNLHTVMALIIVGALVSGLKSVIKSVGWKDKKAWVVLLPMIPDALGVGIAFIPGAAPEMMATPMLKLGWGIVVGLASSRTWKFVNVWFEKQTDIATAAIAPATAPASGSPAPATDSPVPASDPQPPPPSP